MNTMNTSSRALIVVRTAVTAALAVAGLGLATMSHAADAASGLEPARKVVQYGDLNLSNKAAVEHLYSRIVSAAQLVCKDHTGPRLPEEQARTRICIDQSVERAVNQVNVPTLTAFHAAKSGAAPAATVMASNR
jgi:UrcA family protein